METTILNIEKPNKKGQIGLDKVAPIFMLTLLVAVGVITLFIALDALSAESVIPRTTVNVGDVIRNETIRLNATAQTPVSLRNLTGCAFTSTWPELRNESGTPTLVTSGNYTISGCSITASGTVSAPYNTTVLNVSGYYQYTRTSDAVIVVSNVTYGAANFFEQAPTIFSVLGAVIIIGAIVIIILAVARYNRGGSNL